LGATGTRAQPSIIGSTSNSQIQKWVPK